MAGTNKHSLKRHCRIFSPVPRGSGATVIHQLLAENIPGYQIQAYHPYRTLCPLLLSPGMTVNKADIVHTCPDYAWFLADRKKALVLTFHNYVLDAGMRPYSGWLQRIHYRTDLRWWTRLAVRQADRLTAVSAFTAEQVRRELNPPVAIKVIYNGIDTEAFRPAQVSGENQDNTIRVFFSGNLTSRKGAQWLPAIADHLDKNIVIHYTAGLRTRKRLPSRPNLVPVGPVPYADMPERYRNMDLLLMPTVREGFGLSVAEAMASGLPVVASDCSAIPELLDDEKGGYLCPVGNAGAFAEKINLLAASPGLRREMGEYNRHAAEARFTLQRMVREYVRLFNSLEASAH